MLSQDYELAHNDAASASRLLDEISAVYADAYGVEFGEKVDAFRNRAQQAFQTSGFDLVTARSGGDLAGFVFGYSMPADSAWWRGLDPSQAPDFYRETGSRTLVLSEIEVRRDLQRQGLGRRLHDEFIAGRSEERATLATGLDAPSRHVYPRWGWTEVGTVPGAPGSYFSAYRRFILPLQPDEPTN
jgi:GNAT superfamily N-acetyltransferase